MSPSTPPVLCGLALAAMSAAGFSHWWSVRQLALVHRPLSPAPAVSPVRPSPPAIPVPSPPAEAEPSPAREKFYESLLAEIRELRSQNRDLRDQIAETNRDVMKLEFRVDTHSESFRPLPVSEDRLDTTFGSEFDDGPGVLPPRAEPVFLDE